MQNNKKYYVQNNLSIEIYVVGYKMLGESIVLFIRLDNTIIFSAVIDSYSYNGINKTLEILQSNGVSRIDYLCWSHPDEDHSKGLKDIIQKYVDVHTLINIPVDVEIKGEKCSSETKVIFDLLKDNLREGKNKRYRVFEVSDFKDILSYEENYLQIFYNEKEYVIEIKSIAPNSKLIREDSILNSFNKKNIQ